MIRREENPDFINSFLDYSATILNKSPNSIKEYNYDLMMFFRFIKIHFNLTEETDFAKINIYELENLIHPCGFYHTKAKNIKACSQKLISDFHSIVPQTMNELLTLPRCW